MRENATSEPRTNSVRVIIADDHSLYREGLKHLLGSEGQFQVVGEASTGREAMDLIERHHPDVTTLDLGMPDLDGLGLLRKLKEKHSTARILIISQHSDNETIHSLLEVPIHGYVLKSDSPEEILRAVSALAQGNAYFSPRMSERLFELLREKMSRSLPVDPAMTRLAEALSPREIQVAHFICRGKTNKEIAEEIGCSSHTVKSHKSSLMRKIGVNNSAEVVAWCAKAGIA